MTASCNSKPCRQVNRPLHGIFFFKVSVHHSPLHFLRDNVLPSCPYNKNFPKDLGRSWQEFSSKSLGEVRAWFNCVPSNSKAGCLAPGPPAQPASTALLCTWSVLVRIWWIFTSDNFNQSHWRDAAAGLGHVPCGHCGYNCTAFCKPDLSSQFIRTMSQGKLVLGGGGSLAFTNILTGDRIWGLKVCCGCCLQLTFRNHSKAELLNCQACFC